jgi:hypothetical protein
MKTSAPWTLASLKPPLGGRERKRKRKGKGRQHKKMQGYTTNKQIGKEKYSVIEHNSRFSLLYIGKEVL